jgi:predicted lipid-binding transport protein (Tim44 family)
VSIISSVTATPIDDRGDRLADVTDETSVLLIAEEDDSLPGFADAVGGGFAAILLLGSVLLVGVGVTLPFVPLVAVAAFVIIWTRRRRDRREDEREDEREEG